MYYKCKRLTKRIGFAKVWVMKNKGFTVVELLIVISIITILLNFMVLSVRGFQSEARLSQVRADMRAIQVAIEAYYKNHDEYPAEPGYQTQLLNEASQVLEVNEVDPFVPGGTTVYDYTLSPDGTYYAIFSVGINKDGTLEILNDGTLVPGGTVIYVSNIVSN